MDLYSILIQKIIRSKGIELKNEYIVKFEFKTLYAYFRNDPVGRRKVFLSKINEVTESDVCIQEIQQCWGYKYSLATAAYISNKSQVWERNACSKHKCERDGKNISYAKRHGYHCRYFLDWNKKISCTHTVHKNVLWLKNAIAFQNDIEFSRQMNYYP